MLEHMGPLERKPNDIYKGETDMNTKIISAFPGVGKTYLFNHQDEFGLKISDSDSSAFSWIVEKRPGGNKFRNPDFPNNYIEHIKDCIGKFDIVLVSSHENVRKAMKREGIDYCVVYPNVIDRSIYINRYLDRGSDMEFVKLLYDNWDNWIGDILRNEDQTMLYMISGDGYISDMVDILRGE